MALQTRPTIRRGSSGEDVRYWQTIVGTNPDGKFGPQTEAATITWQISNGLTADGVVGPLTWGKLASMAPPSPGVMSAGATAGEQFVALAAMIPSLDDVRTLLGRIPPPIKVAAGVVGAFVGLLTLDAITRKR